MSGMWPVLFRLGPIDITSFGAMVAVGRARRPVGVPPGAGAERVARRRGRRRDLRAARRTDRREAALRLRAPRREPVLLAAARPRRHELVRRLRRRAGGRIPARSAVTDGRSLPVLAAATPALAVGQMLGRVGCFLVGDDYGRPTTLPWGVRFPRGLPPTDVPVHPHATLRGRVSRRARLAADSMAASEDSPISRSSAAYLFLAGLFRFVLEFLRVNTRVLGPFTVAHMFAAVVALVGLALMLSAPRTLATP